jgi:hypothetical protein
MLPVKDQQTALEVFREPAAHCAARTGRAVERTRRAEALHASGPKPTYQCSAVAGSPTAVIP